MPSNGKGGISRRHRQAGAKHAAPTRRPPKASKMLTALQRQMITNAAEHAIRIGKPLNRFVTINWQQAEVAEPDAAHRKFLRLACDWLGEDYACAWVKECGPIVGLHSHILLSVPPHRRQGFNRLYRGWLKQAGIVRLAQGVVKSERIGHSAAAAWSQGEAFAAYCLNLMNVVAYVRKDLASSSDGTGMVIGKRAGTSRNLGAGAIKAWEM